MSILISFLSLILSTFAFLYANKRHKLNMLDHLDDKSEWRKKLFEIAGSSKIGMGNLYQFRAALRFTYKNEDEYYKYNYFECMNIIIIKYCDKLISQNRIEDHKHNENEKDQSYLKNYEMDSIRLFCIYMLADHWEKKQNKNFKFNNPVKEVELCIDTLQKFLNINDKNYCYKCHKSKLNRDNFYCLYHQSISLINSMTS